MDESIDVAGLAILIVIIRYQDENTLLEDLLCKSLQTRTTGVEIFGLLNSFLEENKIPWGNCRAVFNGGQLSLES